MKRAFRLVHAVLLTGLLWTGTACESPGKAGSGAGGMAPPFGGPDDVERATTLWNKTLRHNYTRWDAYPGLAGFQPGKSPHGKFLKYYINSTAARNPRKPGNGAIIVKENYGEKNGSLMAVTVMQKIRGYDPDDADWFWVKYAPNGEIMKNPKGMKLAGRVAKGMPQGCIACHASAAGNDFLFVNDE